MRVQTVSCTLNMSIKAIVHSKCTQISHIQTTCQTAIPIPSLTAQPISPPPPQTAPPIMLRKSPSQSLRYPPLPLRTTNWSSATPRAVRPFLCRPPPCLLFLFLPVAPSPSNCTQLALIPSQPRNVRILRSKWWGDGSFGTVWLCDWHGTLPPNTPMSAMQCGAGARAEYVGKRLVAVKRMKKRWEGGWDECKKLKELEVRQQHIHRYSVLSTTTVTACDTLPP